MKWIRLPHLKHALGPEETLHFHSYLAFLEERSSTSLKVLLVVERAAELILEARGCPDVN